MTTEFFFYYETRGEANHYQAKIAPKIPFAFTFWIEPSPIGDTDENEWLLKFTIKEEITEKDLFKLVSKLQPFPGYDGWGQVVPGEASGSDSSLSSLVSSESE